MVGRFDHRLKRDQVLHPARPVPRLLLQLPRRRLRRLLALIDQPAGKLPPPPVLKEPVTPQQQHPVLPVHQHHHRRPVQPHHVMPEPLPVRQLDIHLAQPHPRVVIDHSLAERLPAARCAVCCSTHSHDANAFSTLTALEPSGTLKVKQSSQLRLPDVTQIYDDPSCTSLWRLNIIAELILVLLLLLAGWINHPAVCADNTKSGVILHYKVPGDTGKTACVLPSCLGARQDCISYRDAGEGVGAEEGRNGYRAKEPTFARFGRWR